MTTKATVTELEVLFTANTAQVDQAAKGVEDRAKKIEKNPIKQKVDGDAKGALDSMDRVEAEAKKIVSAKTVATVDANIDRAETSLTKVQERLDYLHSVEGTMEVTADIKKAEAALKQITRRRDALVSARESMVIDADTAPAEAAIDDVSDKAGVALKGGGGEGGKAFMGGFLGGLLSTPIAGAIVGLGQDIASNLLSGLQVEVRSDRLMATTGLDAATVGKLARAAGEAYASNWGESIEANMDTARVAVQQGLLDPARTARDSQAVITSLAGVADMMGGDIPRVSQAAATIIRSGLAKDAAGAFDIIVRGMQVGNDKAEDWLDTLIEYPSVLTKLGLTGAEMTGLISQGLAAGARNSDVAADALKEFQIRATDASTASTDAYRLIGLNAEEMTAKIAAGGAGAREGLDQVLDGLRSMEDPVARNAAAVGLFGTKAEDLGDALFAMDLSTAVSELGTFEGAAKSALDTLGDNAAGSIASAQRNIEVAADGIKGALAAAFNPQIEGFANFVTENREAVIQFLLDAANGSIDFGRVLVQAIAGGIEAGGDFVAGPLADMIEGFGEALKAASWLLGTGDAGESLTGMADRMRDADDAASSVADTIRTNLIQNTLDPAQDKLNGFGDGFLVDARLHDATTALVNDIDRVGYAADGAALGLDGFDLSNLNATESGRLLNEQLSAVVAGFDEQIASAVAAGEGQDELRGRYDATRQALYDQLVQMGLTGEQADALIATYGLVPQRVDTLVTAQTATAQADSNALKGTLDAIGFSRPNPYVEVSGTEEGIRKLNQLKATLDSVGGFRPVNGAGMLALPSANGNLVQFNARGNLNPMSGARATIVPPNTWRVIGDRPTGDELFAPLDGSARSHALMAEGARRMGAAYLPLASGAVVGGQSVSAATEAYFTDAQVERLAKAFEAGASRAAHAASTRTVGISTRSRPR